MGHERLDYISYTNEYLPVEFRIRFIDGTFFDLRCYSNTLVVNKVNQTLTYVRHGLRDFGIKETHDDVYHHKGRVDGVIKIGLKT